MSTALACLLAGFPSIPVHADGSNSTACQPGYFLRVTGDESDCQACSPGSYSDTMGADNCELCLDTIYSGEGANSAEVLNGDLYCVNTALMEDLDDNFSTTTTTTSKPSSSPTIVQIDTLSPSVPPSLLLTSSRSNLPSIVEGESMCGGSSSEDHFAWHGRCRECPAQYETILFPLFAIFLLASLIGLLEYLIPSCYTSYVWWGVEYLHMIYLTGILPIPWSPIAEFVFEKVLPIFAMDVNRSFSLQCILNVNWLRPEAADQLFVLSLPLLSLVLLTFISKVSNNRIIQDESVSRWVTLFLYTGYLKIVLSSLEVLEFPTSWSGDDLSVWTSSDQFYATMAGLAGFLIYGIAFPFWFLQSLFRYSRLDVDLAKADLSAEECERDDIESGGQRRKAQVLKKRNTKRKKELFMTFGIFAIETLGARVWWWPGLLMLRKLLLAILLVKFPDAPILLLVVFLMLHFLGVVLLQRFLFFKAESGEQASCVRIKKNWSHIATVDTVLQICLATMIGVAFFSVWTFGGGENTRSSVQKWVEDILVLSIVVTSSLYLAFAIGVCCTRIEPRFPTVASNMIVVNLNNFRNNPDDSEPPAYMKNDDSVIGIKESFSTASSSSHDDSKDEIEFLSGTLDGIDRCNDVTMESNSSEEYPMPWQPQEPVIYGFERPSPYVLGEDVNDYIEESHASPDQDPPEPIQRPKLFRSDSTIATNEREEEIAHGEDMDVDDMGTVYEEVWIDEETGEQIEDPKQGEWMDVETGIRAVPLE